jgi:hypothetical protein
MQHRVTAGVVARLALPAALLAIALGIAVANGRIGDSVVIGALLVPPLTLVALALYVRATRRHGR